MPQRSVEEGTSMNRKLVVILVAIAAACWNVTGIADVFGQSSKSNDPIKLSASFKLMKGKKTGLVMLTATMPKSHYIYSLTQKKLPPPTKLSVEESKKYKVTGKFKANKKPTVVEKDEIFNNRVEKHYQTVVFSAPIELSDDADASSLEIVIMMNGQVCTDENCTMIRGKKTVAKYSGTLKEKPKKENSK